MKKINTLLLLLFLSLCVISCSKDDPIIESGNHDTPNTGENNTSPVLSEDMYQENHRKYQSDEISYELQKDVLLLSDAQQKFLKKLDGNSTLVFSDSVSQYSLPAVGNLIVCLNPTDALPLGFQGRVKEVRHNDDGTISIITEMAAVEDIFSDLKISDNVDIADYQLLDSLGNPLPYKEVYLSTDSMVWDNQALDNIDLYSYDAVTRANLEARIGREYSISFGRGLEVSGTLSLQGSIALDYDLFRHYMSIEPQLTASLGVSCTVKGGVGFDQTKKLIGTIPGIRYYFLSLNLNFYQYWTAEAEVGIACECVLSASASAKLCYESNEWSLTGNIGGSAKNPFRNIELTGSAETGFGLRTMFGINFLQYPIVDFDNAYADIWAGLSGEFSAKKISGYDILKNTEVNFGAKAGWHYESVRNPFSNNNDLVENEYSANVDLFKFHVYPTFLDWEHEQQSDIINIKSTQSWNMLFPIKTGYLIKNENDEVVDKYKGEWYWIEDFSPRELKYDFSDFKPGKKYYVYPYVCYFDQIDVVSIEPYEIETEKIPVTIVDFVQTKSYFTKNDFIYKGRTYDYRYNCSITVQLDEEADLSDIEDWGYIYKDPDGELAKISLSEFTSPYTDSRFAFFRNSDNDTVVLFEYVKYKNDPELYFGIEKKYPVTKTFCYKCPDNNHPHAIDLGLPSGTKWACCNVGASEPYMTGNCFHWGETNAQPYYEIAHVDIHQWEKWWMPDIYTYFGTYYLTKYCTVKDQAYGYRPDYKTVLDLGDDPAYNNMNRQWRTPTIQDYEELLNYCDISHNREGVPDRGLCVTGKNNNIIFFPGGDSGSYWTSSLNEELNRIAHCFFYNIDYVELAGSGRGNSLYVRAVLRN